MGVYGKVFLCRIPFSDRYCLKAREVYSPLLSDRSDFTLCPVQFSTSANHQEKTVRALSFDLNESAQTFYVQSSTKVMKYRELLSDLLGIGPHMSEWINSRGCRTISGYKLLYLCPLLIRRFPRLIIQVDSFRVVLYRALLRLACGWRPDSFSVQVHAVLGPG